MKTLHLYPDGSPYWIVDILSYEELCKLPIPRLLDLRNSKQKFVIAINKGNHEPSRGPMPEVHKEFLEYYALMTIILETQDMQNENQ